MQLDTSVPMPENKDTFFTEALFKKGTDFENNLNAHNRSYHRPWNMQQINNEVDQSSNMHRSPKHCLNKKAIYKCNSMMSFSETQCHVCHVCQVWKHTNQTENKG